MKLSQTGHFHTTDAIKKSSKKCALKLSTDGSEDDTIHCIKNSQTCKSTKEILVSQLSILSQKDEKPFIDIHDNDIDMVAPVFMSIDSDQEDDESIEIRYILTERSEKKL